MRAVHARMSFTRKLLAACTACAVALYLVSTNLGTSGEDIAAVAPADPRRETVPTAGVEPNKQATPGVAQNQDSSRPLIAYMMDVTSSTLQNAEDNLKQKLLRTPLISHCDEEPGGAWVECDSVEHRMCPIPDQKAATFDDKNFYKSKRTAQEVAWGLRENTRMLNWIQESSKLPIVVMYGSLIGLWWNQQSLPWDTDV